MKKKIEMLQHFAEKGNCLEVRCDDCGLKAECFCDNSIQEQLAKLGAEMKIKGTNINAIIQENEQLKQQNEKMKNCQNCGNYLTVYCNKCTDKVLWELAE